MERAGRHQHEESQRRVPSDPEGYATGSRSCRNKDEMQVLSEEKLRQVMNRSRVQDDRRSRSVSQSQSHDRVAHRTNDHRDTIWNSFTGSYAGDSRLGDSQSDDERDGSDGEHTTPSRSVPASRTNVRRENDGYRYTDENGRPCWRPRKVKFAAKLEIDTKVLPELPKTPTLSILRKRGAKKRIADHDNLPTSRDPPPHDRLDPTEKGIVILDPPMDLSKNPLVSPTSVPTGRRAVAGAERRVRSAEKVKNPFALHLQPSRTHFDADRRARSAEPQTKRRFMEPPAPSRNISPRSDLWTIVDRLKRSGKTEESPTQELIPTNLYSSDSYADSPESDNKKLIPANLHSSDFYTGSPESDDMSAVALSPLEPSQLPLSWRMDCPSPDSQTSTESQTSYLINKYGGRYSGRSRVMMAARSLVRAAGTVATPGLGGGSTPGSTTVVVDPVGTGTGTKASTKQAGYAHLNEIPESPQGLEMILLPEKPYLIGFTIEADSSVGAVRDVKGKSQNDTRVSRRSAPQSSHGHPLHALVGHAGEYDIEDIGIPSTSDTDDSESGIFFNWRGSEWDTFEANDEVGDKDDVHLIPSSRPGSRKILRRVLLLSLVVIAGLVVGAAIHIKMGLKSYESVLFPIDSSPCVRNNIVSSNRFLQIRSHLIDAFQEDIVLLDVVNTPQRKALCWIADVDERRLQVNEEGVAALIQRYTLAVLYFSLVKEATQDPASLKNTNFLSSEHECDWEVIMCNRKKTVTALLLADKMLSGRLPAEIGNLGNLCKLKERYKCRYF
jgi:hypothetical protein